jgi:hypothetical protein
LILAVPVRPARDDEKQRAAEPAVP